MHHESPSHPSSLISTPLRYHDDLVYTLKKCVQKMTEIGVQDDIITHAQILLNKIEKDG